MTGELHMYNSVDNQPLVIILASVSNTDELILCVESVDPVLRLYHNISPQIFPQQL